MISSHSRPLKLYLDDRRLAPDGWIRCYWPEEVIHYLRIYEVSHLSLDHDLGDAEAAVAECRTERTGYSVVLWVEEEVRCNSFLPPIMMVHSDNPMGRNRMQAGIDSIEKFCMDFFN